LGIAVNLFPVYPHSGFYMYLYLLVCKHYRCGLYLYVWECTHLA